MSTINFLSSCSDPLLIPSRLMPFECSFYSFNYPVYLWVAWSRFDMSHIVAQTNVLRNYFLFVDIFGIVRWFILVTIFLAFPQFSYIIVI